MKVVVCEITCCNLMDMQPPTPYPVQIRLKLNKAGFRFEDDDNPFGLVVNLDPAPLGKFTWWEDFESGSKHFRQELDE